jgi:hypothetical protein
LAEFGAWLARDLVRPPDRYGVLLSFEGEKTMRALAAAVALSLLTAAALIASPEVEAAIKVFQSMGTEPNQLKTFCALMQIDDKMAGKADPSLEAQMDELLDKLGADFKAAWETVEHIDPASDDGKVLNAALDRLSDKCAH